MYIGFKKVTSGGICDLSLKSAVSLVCQESSNILYIHIYLIYINFYSFDFHRFWKRVHSMLRFHLCIV